MNGSLPPQGNLSHLRSHLAQFIPSTSVPWAVPPLSRPLVVGPGYSPVPEKLVTKIRTGQFIDLTDLLAENLKVQELKPQTYFGGKLHVTSSKRDHRHRDMGQSFHRVFLDLL